MANEVPDKFFVEGLIVLCADDNNLFVRDGMLTNDELDITRKICPNLFKIGHNVVNDKDLFHWNIFELDNLEKEFPGVAFDTAENIEIFSNNNTFYPVSDVTSLTGDDILGNEYSDPDTGIVFIRIKPKKLSGPFQVYSVIELMAIFMEHFEFVDPHSRDSERFSELEIKRLNKLLNDIIFNEQASCLIDIIGGINTGIFKRSKLIEEIGEFYVDNYDIAKGYFTELLHIGFKMRGWKGEGEYPLKSKDTGGEVEYDKLQDEIIKFNNDELSLRDLPIFMYQGGEFKMSIKSKYGYSIHDRITIILENSDDNACIRLSSNWLLATAWYYMDRYFNERPFPKDDLDAIF
jgi:hypothetical protein